jgi:hypothetical protein
MVYSPGLKAGSRFDLLRGACLCVMRAKIRWFLASSVIVAMSWAVYTVIKATRTAPDMVTTVDYSEPRAAVFEFLRDDAKRFLDAEILVLAALWSIAIVKKDDRIRGTDLPEILMFVATLLLSILFLYLNQEYGHIFERASWDVASAKRLLDPFNSPYLTLYSSAAAAVFYVTVFASALMVFSLCVVRERPSEATAKEEDRE